MKKINQLLVFSGLALALAFSGTNVMAQGGGFGGGGFGGGGGGGGGGFDPTQIVPMMVARMRDSLAVTNDDDWKAIEPRLEKVVKLKMEERTAGMGGMFGGRGGAGGGGRVQGLTALMGEPDPSVDALQKALDDNAPVAEVKAAMAKVRESRLQKRAALLKAQDELKELLSTRQEATLLLSGQLE